MDQTSKLLPNVQALIEAGEFQNRWEYNVDSEVYHEDRTHVSSTILKTIRKSGAAFKGHFDGKWPKEPTDAMRFGSGAHCAVLEGSKAFFSRYRVMEDFGDLRFKENKQAKVKWLSELPPGVQAIDADEFADMQGVVESILAHQDAFNLLKNSAREVSGYYVCPDTKIRCRIRPDIVSNDLSFLVDFKTTVDCSIDAFAAKICNMGWDFSLAMYGCGAEAISGMFPKECAFIACEPKPPYECAVYFPDIAFMDIGLRNYRNALLKLRRCIDENNFPRYQERLQTISPPIWHFKGESL